jgi:hypothetical protein
MVTYRQMNQYDKRKTWVCKFNYSKSNEERKVKSTILREALPLLQDKTGVNKDRKSELSAKTVAYIRPRV